MTRATSSTTARSLHSPSTSASCPEPAARTGQKRKARSSGRSATSARTSSSGAHSEISMTSIASSPTGSTRSPTSACMARRSGSCRRPSAEKPDLQPLPATPFDALLKLERRVSHDGLVSIGGNYYSVPDRTRRIVEVHQLPDIIRILDGGRLVATHPVLEGRRQYRVDPAHRQGGAARALRHGDVGSVIIGRRGDHVARRSLAFYQAIGEHLAGGIGGRS